MGAWLVEIPIDGVYAIESQHDGSIQLLGFLDGAGKLVGQQPLGLRIVAGNSSRRRTKRNARLLSTRDDILPCSGVKAQMWT